MRHPTSRSRARPAACACAARGICSWRTYCEAAVLKSTHRDVQWEALFWGLQRRWAYYGTIEVTTLHHGSLDAMVVSHPDQPSRIGGFEVKVQRSDLLRDLRAGKMIKYEGVCTHCWLVVTEDCMQSTTKDAILAELQELGLPKHWGVLRYKHPRASRHEMQPPIPGSLVSLRTAKPTGYKPRPREASMRVRNFAKSASYRLALLETDLRHTWRHERAKMDALFEQPAPEPGGPAVWDLAYAWLRESGMYAVADAGMARDALGLQRYGRRLEVGNGRSAAHDALAECLDGIAYLTQLGEELGQDLSEERMMLAGVAEKLLPLCQEDRIKRVAPDVVLEL